MLLTWHSVQRLKTIIEITRHQKITLWYVVTLEIAEKSHFDRKKKKTCQISSILTNWVPNVMLISQKL